VTEFLSGDVMATYTGGHNRYVRVGGPHPTEPRIWVQDCDGAGFLIGNAGRYLKAETLATRYRVHYRPTERYDVARATVADTTKEPS
jgi:hypothetical protein